VKETPMTHPQRHTRHLTELFHPALYSGEAVDVRYVKDEQRGYDQRSALVARRRIEVGLTVGITVVDGPERMKPFLPGCVPDGQV